MAILSHEAYLNRWTVPAPNGFGQTICPPCYHEYLQREIYFNDYLDLFKNERTFVRRLHLGRFYVAINGCPILDLLDIPEHNFYTIKIEEILYILVDYDYPWNEEELMKKRCIKYIMIGEAAPTQNAKRVGYGADDKENSFFYNKLHLNQTLYFTEPSIVFNTGLNPLRNSTNKRNSLLGFANKGVVLFDLYPFAITYSSKFRSALRIDVFYRNLIDRLTHNIGLFSAPNELKFALVGPTITTTKIITKSVETGGLIFGGYTILLDSLTNNGITDNMLIWSTRNCITPVRALPNIIGGYHTLTPIFGPTNLTTINLEGRHFHHISVRERLSVVHFNRLIAVPKGGNGPHRILLAFSFNL